MGRSFEYMACALVGDTVHVCGTSSDGSLSHTYRPSGGTWQPWVDVIAGDNVPNGGGVSNSKTLAFGSVQCLGNLIGELQVLFISGPGPKDYESLGPNGEALQHDAGRRWLVEPAGQDIGEFSGSVTRQN